MARAVDGPASPLFSTVPLEGNTTFKKLASNKKFSQTLQDHAGEAPTGECVCFGLPFTVQKPLLLAEEPVTIELGKLEARWLVFMHTADEAPLDWNKDGFVSPTRGWGRLNEHVADYVLVYADGTEARESILRRHHLGMIQRGWGENCFQAVAHRKPLSLRPPHEQAGGTLEESNAIIWGQSQTRVRVPDLLPWINWLWAWENPQPGKKIAAVRFEPVQGTVIVSGLCAGNGEANPLRWGTRKKALLKLPKGASFTGGTDRKGQWADLSIDLGQVISVVQQSQYPKAGWGQSYNNQLPKLASDKVLVEYAAAPDASFHLKGGQTISVARVESSKTSTPLTPVAPATQRVTLRVVEKNSRMPVPVKLHVHGEAGEYLAPVDRHRIPNPAWFEDYSVDFLNQDRHLCTYIPGETTLDLPLGKVYLEISKGFEIKPVRKTYKIGPGTRKIELVIDSVLPWREKNWVTADTHVHFLSPSSAQLEGAAEGVNVINLLASQWGELMTNVGDFDGKTTFGSKEAGGDGEWLVRVGTENRQHVLGHLSLLGYEGNIIAPMCSGGPDESALGDPVGVLMTEWARQCRAQNGLVVIPHFPNPRAENAALLVNGDADAIEMCSWGNLYGGIDPYSLSDWYRYLNCGYFTPAVAGTDKMSANTPVGAIRTYAKIAKDRAFTYENWKDAVRGGHTFVSYGPLLEFAVDGKPAGTRIKMKRTGGAVDVTWEAASVTIPMSRVDLIVNGAIRESQTVMKWKAEGHWTVKIDRSSWLALLVRGHYADKPEIIAAHSSPVVVDVEASPFYAAADAETILEQIEGALAYLDTTGTKADDRTYKRMRRILTGAHRTLHNRMHQLGHDHAHTAGHAHAEHQQTKKRRK
ncbi:MAG: CehA/McbA family metallohydrolase [Candidatus Hydrogenedentes bacterium]|nr:CehA/McbA family metallohydrolase [Candidatus Hydrogenedentota bacterium]